MSPAVLDRIRQEHEQLTEKVRGFEPSDEAQRCLREAGEAASLMGQDILSIGENEPDLLENPAIKPVIAHWEAMGGKFGEGLDKLVA